MQGHIAKHGDQINGVWAADDAMMLGAIEAVRKGRHGEQGEVRL